MNYYRNLFYFDFKLGYSELYYEINKNASHKLNENFFDGRNLISDERLGS